MSTQPLWTSWVLTAVPVNPSSRGCRRFPARNPRHIEQVKHIRSVVFAQFHQFSDAVNRAAFGGEVTFGTRGRGR